MQYTGVCSLVLVLSSAAVGCAVTEESPEVETASQTILGGTPASAGQFPTVVAVVVAQGQRGMCTGTLVAPDLVLTAAHCVDPGTLGYSTQEQVTAQTQVVFDATNLQSGQFGPVRAASQTIAHPRFNRPGDPDVGLVRLSQPVMDRQPSPVNINPDSAPVGVSVTMVGYGVTERGGGGTNMFLENKTSSSCATGGVSNDTFLCFSQTDGTGKCSGDSGGPSFINLNGNPHTVVGITSFGDQECAIFGADMRTDASVEFFREHAPELLCGGDGFCEESCGGTAPVDPDCSNCAEDSECGDAEFCDDGFCTPEALSPGGLGSSCESGTDCFNGVCADGPDGKRCSDMCDEANACPSGFDCLSAGETGACWPAEGGGGCQSGGNAPAGLGALLLLALVAASRRRA